MAAKQVGEEKRRIIELLEVVAITLLTKSGTPQKDIQAIVGVDINRVNRIAKKVKKSK